MKIKERCIYYNPVKDGYYLVLSADSKMIYGRYGEMENPSYLDSYMNQDGTGLRFKIDNIIINSDYWRNYYLDEKELDKFELIKELTDEEFYPIEILTSSRNKYPNIVINIHNHMNDVSDIVYTIKHKELEVEKLTNDISNLEKKLFYSMQQ